MHGPLVRYRSLKDSSGSRGTLIKFVLGPMKIHPARSRKFSTEMHLVKDLESRPTVCLQGCARVDLGCVGCRAAVAVSRKAAKEMQGQTCE